MLDALQALDGILIAITALLTVLLVNARRAKAEADRMNAETQQILHGIRRDTNVAVEQVANSHGTNLRDDIDILKRLVETTNTTVASLANDLRDERRRITKIVADAHDSHAEIYGRLRNLEKDRT